ncbi:MAG TPA: DUF72 domain-containing protein [Gaiellaceae bacterium]|nr:DUF72 domain-containing protein [Gaiellaceae bacterium]
MREAGQRSVRIGCSGWNYESWRNGVFYPERCPARLWLETYARSFDTVEVNATFYRLPTTKAVQGWVDQTPDDFCFAVKASRYLTHIKRLRELEGGIARFMERLEPLVRSPKLGPLLWQLPPNFARDDERLAAALDALPPGRHAFEFRHASWFADDVYALLHEHGAALVIGDRPEVHAFQTHELTADWAFVRFHSGSRGRRGNYSESELREWAARLRSWPVREAYAYFNNDWEGFAPRNALRLKELLGT